MRGSTIVLVLYPSLPSSSTIYIVVSGPNVTPLVMEGLLKERSYCSVVSRATVSLMIIKLDSPWDWDPRPTNVIVSFMSTPDNSTDKGWVPGPTITR